MTKELKAILEEIKANYSGAVRLNECLEKAIIKVNKIEQVFLIKDRALIQAEQEIKETCRIASLSEKDCSNCPWNPECDIRGVMTSIEEALQSGKVRNR